MPATKNQHLRLEILDELLSLRGWTLKELLERINHRIGDAFDPIDKRTLFRDMKYLIEQKNAPVHRPERKDNRYYYTQSFSLKNVPLDEDDLSSLKNAIQILRQVDSLPLISEVDDIIRKLENRVHIQTTQQPVVIQFEKHTSSSGTQYINDLMEAIKNKNVLKVRYQPYSHPEAGDRIVHPYLLKEFRNRWFLLGREGNANRVTNYALDRIKKIRPLNENYIENDLFDPSQYFNHLIGVSVPENAKPENIQIKVYKHAAPYVASKPIHLNQETLRVYKDGSILIKLNLIINYELKSMLLSYGSGLEIKKPKSLRDELAEALKKMLALYR